VVSLLEASGCSGVILEDQQRPRRCGHFEGKNIMPLDEYLHKLKRVLAVRRDMIVVARTDVSDPDEILNRIVAFEHAGADAILVDAVEDIGTLRSLKSRLSIPLLYNQISGGKSPPLCTKDMKSAGVSIALYSTPCLFAAHAAIETAMQSLKSRDGLLEPENNTDIENCTSLLNANLKRE